MMQKDRFIIAQGNLFLNNMGMGEVTDIVQQA